MVPVIHKQPTRLDTEHFAMWRAMGISLDDRGFVLGKTDSENEQPPHPDGMRDDMIANELVWILSHIGTSMATQDADGSPYFDRPSLQRNATIARWNTVQQRLDHWIDTAPPSFKPCARVYANIGGPYPTSSGTQSDIEETWYSDSMCASAIQSYHMARILLLIHQPVELLGSTVSPSSEQHDVISTYHNFQKILQSHARKIYSISLSRPGDSARIHQLQPLYYAGRCLTEDGEQQLVLDLIRGIEHDLGWATEYRAQQLISEWADRREKMRTE